MTLTSHALDALLHDLVETAVSNGGNIIVTLAPGDRPVRLVCPQCHAVLAQQVAGIGTVTHRCPNKGCPAHETPVRQVFVVPR